MDGKNTQQEDTQQQAPSPQEQLYPTNSSTLPNEKILTGISIVILIVALGVGGYFWLLRKPTVSIAPLSIKQQTQVNEQKQVSKPTDLQNARIIGSYTSSGESNQVVVINGIAYLTDISQGILAIDVSTPTHPQLLDSIKIGGGGAYAVASQLSNLIGIEATPYLLVSGYGNSKVALVDIGGTLAEVKVQSLPTGELRVVAEGSAKRSVQNMTSFGLAWYLAIDGPEFEIFQTILLGREMIPQISSSGPIKTSPGGHVLDLAVSDDRKLFVAQGERGLAIFDLGERSMDLTSLEVNGNRLSLPSTPSLINPKLVSTIDVDGYAQAVAVDT